MQTSDLKAKGMLKIRVLEIENGQLIIQGTEKLSVQDGVIRFFAADENGNEYAADIQPYSDPGSKGGGEKPDVEECRYSIIIPAADGLCVAFYAETGQQTVELSPGYDKYIGLNRKERHSYMIKSGYIVICRGISLYLMKDTAKNRRHAETRYALSSIRKKGAGWLKTRAGEISLRNEIEKKKLKNQAAFVSVRADDHLMGNLERVYSEADFPKIFYSKKDPEKTPEYMGEMSKLIASSKVLVTDDYLYPLRTIRKKEGQFFIQLWHAAGAFKKFGVGESGMFPEVDALYHRDYDLVAVSSEYVREIYAKAFRVDADKVKAIGIPRTDKWYDPEYIENTRKSVKDRVPEISGKQIILYAPSFRKPPGRERVYIPEVDYKAINDALGEDQIMLLCPHPLMPPFEGVWEYDRIKLLQNIPTDDVMTVADLLITDYSSVIFEFSLLNKPMMFFCYDYDTYDKDFYLDYEKDLPGDIIRSTEELIVRLKEKDFKADDNLSAFREKYMSACDGKSTERVVNAISEYLNRGR